MDRAGRLIGGTDEYTCEASPETVFNQGIMRQSIEPFEATNATFVR
ncbi:hypothetical protein ACUNV4_16260 [Granulosicoccus sp. 3-233]